MKFRPKVWAAIGSIASTSLAVAALASNPVPGEEMSPFPEGFATALDKLLDGEGGEGGAGMSPMRRSVMVPALDEKQLKLALTGNTIRLDWHLALHFSEAGKVNGWQTSWDQASMERCPTTLSATYSRENGKCYVANRREISGAWEVRDSQVCLPSLALGSTGTHCYTMVVLLDKVALFDEHGKLVGRGHNLAKGRVLADSLSD
jgi:hypothetical protein